MLWTRGLWEFEGSRRALRWGNRPGLLFPFVVLGRPVPSLSLISSMCSSGLGGWSVFRLTAKQQQQRGFTASPSVSPQLGAKQRVGGVGPAQESRGASEESVGQALPLPDC